MWKVRKRAVLNKFMRGDIFEKAIFEQRLEARKLTMSRYTRKKSIQRCDAQILRWDSPDMFSEHERVIVVGAQCVRGKQQERKSQRQGARSEGRIGESLGGGRPLLYGKLKPLQNFEQSMI